MYERSKQAKSCILPGGFMFRLTSRSCCQCRMAAVSQSRRPCARDFIARIRFRRNERGELEVYSNLLGPNSVSRVGNKHLAELLFDRPDALRVEQLGASELVMLTQDQSAVLLRVTLADEMQAEARKKLSPDDQERYLPDLFRIDLGPDSPAPDKAQSGK